MARKKQQVDSPSVPMAQTEKYHVHLDMSGNVYDATGDTAQEAFTNLPVTFMEVKTKGVITLIYGEKSAERLFYLRPLKALIAGKVRKIGIAKQMESMLK